MSTQPKFTMYELMEAGVHFGHQTHRWNPKMAEYIFGSQNNNQDGIRRKKNKIKSSKDKIHIIDLQQTVELLARALEVLKQVAKNNGRILFVGTKRQAVDIIEEYAKKCGQHFVNHKWCAGTLTNWGTVSKSIDNFKKLDEKIKLETNSAEPSLTKKEISKLIKQYNKDNLSLGGIADMGGKPDILVVLDSNKEAISIREACKLDIPIISILDSNSNPDNITHPIPGNDDATRAIQLYCRLFADAIIEGIRESSAKYDMEKGDRAVIGSNDVDSLTKKMKNLDISDEDKI